jgi:2,4-dienoyl-CoA reductase-like NADH-dependent reductase (Old Yellow Enzyme family)
MHWRCFDYKTLNALQDDIAELNADLPISEDLGILAEPIALYGKTIKNRLAIQPLEGFDATEEGTPSELTFRRYKRFSAGGAGLIWFESSSTSSKNKTSRWQCQITDKNLPVYRQLLNEIRGNASDGVPPFMIGQISDNGRNAVSDNGKRMIAVDNPYLAKPNTEIMSDAHIDKVMDDYVETAALFKEAGFDAIDLKTCHSFLISDLLSAFTRENSTYGGSFEDRTRFLLETVDRINAEVGISLGVRLSACDLLPYPYGWGMRADGTMPPDLSEPITLAKLLVERGVKLLNIAVGRNAMHIQSPYNHYSHYPQEHQLTALDLYQGCAAAIKKACPDAVVVAGAFSWARHFSGHIAAGGIRAGRYDLAGFGRMALAYPDFANDIIHHGGMLEKKCCTACNNCWNMVGAAAPEKSPVGCPVRDKDLYGMLYKKNVGKKKRNMSSTAVEMFGMLDTPPKNTIPH